MKKTVLAWLLALLMLVSILAVPVAAEGTLDIESSPGPVVEDGESPSPEGKDGDDSKGDDPPEDGNPPENSGGDEIPEAGAGGSGGDGTPEGDGGANDGGQGNTPEVPETECTHAWVYVEIKPTCIEYGATGYGCSYCGAVKDVVAIGMVPHGYDNACDVNCNVCNATRTVTHSFSSQWSKNSSSHWHACNICGEKSDIGNHYPGPAATEEKAQYCLTCGLMMMPKKAHTHNYSTVYTSDETAHWYACDHCDERKDVEQHTYDNLCDPDCNVCGYTTQRAHVYDTQWQSDQTGHWNTCSVCGEKKPLEAHIPGPEATDTIPQLCEICHFELAPALTHMHNAGEAWQSDESSHWKLCECGERLEVNAHIWDGGTEGEDGQTRYLCQECGRERLEETPAGGFPWAILLVMAVILPLAAVVLVFLLKGPRQGGKFHG